MRPQPGDYPVFFEKYINQAVGDDVKTTVSNSLLQLEQFLYSIPEDKADYAYAPGKWTVKELLQHCIDTERIFAYRALCHARGEQQSLPGFEQNDYAALADVSVRTLTGLTEEMLLVRKTTHILFQSFNDDSLNRTGITNGNSIKTFC